MKRLTKKARSRARDNVPYDKEDALAVFVDTRLTKDAYQKIRLGAIMRGANIYPFYDEIIDAKESCYPVDIKVDERGKMMGYRSHYVQGNF